MEKEKVNQFMMLNAKYFPEVNQVDIRKALEEADESKANMVISSEWKNPTVCFILAFFLGNLGADRFYLGDTGLAVAKLLTCGGAAIWAIVDLFTAFGRAKKTNYSKFLQLIA